jgi:hypothetical protein
MRCPACQCRLKPARTLPALRTCRKSGCHQRWHITRDSQGHFVYHLPLEAPPTLHWEHGYRCHGYWLGPQRVGQVSLSPPGCSPVVYYWSLDQLGCGEEQAMALGYQGEAGALPVAKACVEEAYRRLQEAR